MVNKLFFALLIVVSSISFASAQSKQKPENAIKKYETSKLTTFLGSYKDSVGLPISEVTKIIGLPLTVVDNNKVNFKITAYQVVYTRNAIVESEDGKHIPTKSIVSQIFYNTPMSDIWVKSIRDLLKKGEEIFFFGIIAKDPKNGQVSYAPNFKITVL